MLRLPPFELATPSSIEQALELLERHGERAMILGGGTDLLPNMKHELFTPNVVVSLAGIKELNGIRVGAEGTLESGAMTTLEEGAGNPRVRERAPALAQATAVVAGPQHREMATIGGNVMLDTRCRWYNQSYFWRSALGFCLKKDGEDCHVLRGGRNCVAAASNDSAPALMTVGARLHLRGPGGARELALDDLWTADGTWNKRSARNELLVSITIPAGPAGHRGAYLKLRQRGSIDFPLLGVAVRVDLDEQGDVLDADLVLGALQARPLRVKAAAKLLRGTHPDPSPSFAGALDTVAEAARRRCKPVANIPGDADYRRAMVPVYVRRAFARALDLEQDGSGATNSSVRRRA